MPVLNLMKCLFLKMKKLLDNGHIYLKRYKVVSIFIVIFFAWQCYELTEWYKKNFEDLKEWQNAPVIGIILSYIAALKFALEHILEPDKDV